METSKTSKTAARASLAGQAGMTLLEILIVLAIIALVMGVLFGPRLMSMFSDAQSKTAKLQVKQMADQAFPQWRVNNPGKGCPDDISEVAKYTNDNNAKDPWENKLVLLCGDQAPEGTTVGVLSLGEDGKQGTDDDVRSWEAPSEKK